MQSSNPLVSVIITCYNQEKYISQAIQSVLEQTYTYWECFVVDDGSTDGSAAIIDNFCKKDERIFLIQQENKGVSKARNIGFSKANGELIQFLDGDDWFLPQKLEKQVHFFQKNTNIDVCYVKHNYFIEKSHTTKTFNFEILENKPLKQFLYKWHGAVAIPPHAFLFKKSIWGKNECPFPEDYILREEDWVFHVLTSMKNINYGYINEILCTYFIGNENFTSSILNSCINSIEAAYYIKNLLPTAEKDFFLKHNLKKAILRYHTEKKIDVLKASISWKIGNFLTTPLHIIAKKYKKIF